jgi:hypothetical protein
LAAGAVVIAGVCFAAAEGPSPKAAKDPSAPADEEARPQLSVPGFWALALPPVQTELLMTAEERQQLQAISARSQAKAQAAMADLQRLSPEEQRKRLPALRQQARKDLEAIRKEVANVLTPQQLQAYEKVAFRLRVAYALEDARLLAALGLTDWQKEKIGQIRDNLEERLHHVQCEAADKTLDILTAAQQEKLKERLNQEGL